MFCAPRSSNAAALAGANMAPKHVADPAEEKRIEDEILNPPPRAAAPLGVHLELVADATDAPVIPVGPVTDERNTDHKFVCRPIVVVADGDSSDDDDTDDFAPPVVLTKHDIGELGLAPSIYHIDAHDVCPVGDEGKACRAILATANAGVEWRTAFESDASRAKDTKRFLARFPGRPHCADESQLHKLTFEYALATEAADQSTLAQIGTAQGAIPLLIEPGATERVYGKALCVSSDEAVPFRERCAHGVLVSARIVGGSVNTTGTSFDVRLNTPDVTTGAFRAQYVEAGVRTGGALVASLPADTRAHDEPLAGDCNLALMSRDAVGVFNTPDSACARTLTRAAILAAIETKRIPLRPSDGGVRRLRFLVPTSADESYVPKDIAEWFVATRMLELRELCKADTKKYGPAPELNVHQVLAPPNPDDPNAERAKLDAIEMHEDALVCVVDAFLDKYGAAAVNAVNLGAHFVELVPRNGAQGWIDMARNAAGDRSRATDPVRLTVRVEMIVLALPGTGPVDAAVAAKTKAESEAKARIARAILPPLPVGTPAPPVRSGATYGAKFATAAAAASTAARQSAHQQELFGARLAAAATARRPISSSRIYDDE
jgi:hypothetical protein